MIMTKIKLALFIIFCVILAGLFIFAKSDMANTADDFANQSTLMNDNKGVNSKAQFDKQYNYQNSVKVAEDNKINSLSTITNDKVGNYPIEYYVGFPLYEGTMLSVNSSDGGFGPLQETHSGLGNCIDKMYDTGLFPWLEPFSSNPLSFLKSCKGGDHANHSWNSCRTHAAGSNLLKSAVEQNCTTPEQIKQFYDQYMIAAEGDYLIPALKRLKEITGKSENEIGPGTIACIFAIYVRWGSGKGKNQKGGYWCSQNLTSSMTDDEMIDSMMAWARGRSSEKRWICGGSIYKAMNAGTIDIYGSYQCDGSCGTLHKTKAGNTFGELFGKGD